MTEIVLSNAEVTGRPSECKAGGRRLRHAAVSAMPSTRPPTIGAPNFEVDVRNLFLAFDRDSVIGWFDMHSCDDSKANAVSF